MPPLAVTQKDDPAIATASAEFRIDAEFREYRPGEFCRYKISPVSKGEKAHDSEGQPIWKLGENQAKADISLHVGHYQKPYTLKGDAQNHIPTTIRLESHKGRGRIHLNIVVSLRWNPETGKSVDAVSSYHPVGLVFLRADQTEDATGQPREIMPEYAKANPSAGIPYVTGHYRDGPFENVEINGAGNYVRFEMVRTHRVPPIEDHIPKPEQTTHRTYRIWIIIQEATTGKIGIIDPEGEDPNTQQ